MPAGKLPRLPRSANSEASSRPAPPGKKSFASSQSACAVCFQVPPAPFHCSAALENRVESAARMGGSCPTDRIFSPEQCWALRRGCTHAHPGGTFPSPRCSHLLGEGPSVCIPLIANGDTFGTLAIQNDEPLSPISGPNRRVRRPLLAASSSPLPPPKHISVAICQPQPA